MKPSFNPEPEATAVLTRDCRPETAGASGFGLNKEAVGRLRLTKHGLPLRSPMRMHNAVQKRLPEVMRKG
jgi:hypothetical protein